MLKNKVQTEFLIIFYIDELCQQLKRGSGINLDKYDLSIQMNYSRIELVRVVSFEHGDRVVVIK